MRIAGIIVGVLMVLFGGGCVLTAQMAGGPEAMVLGLPPFVGGIILTMNAYGKKPGEEFSGWAKVAIIISGIIFGLASIVALMALISLAVEFW